MNVDTYDPITPYADKNYEEKNEMKLIGRKLYINTEYDKWLTDNFGAQRERSRAVDLALRDFIMKIESNRKKITTGKIDLDLID